MMRGLFTLGGTMPTFCSPRSLVLASLAASLLACAPDPPWASDPVRVSAEPSPEFRAEQRELLAELAELESLDADALLASHEVAHVSLSYDPMDASNLALIQASSLALNADELARLERDGLVIRDDHRFPTFAYGYVAIYFEDLPIFISADSILEALHRGYDGALTSLELDSLAPELAALLTSMRERLAGGLGAGFDPRLRADADLYLSVAYALLSGEEATCVAGGATEDARTLVEAALLHDGIETRTLFGAARIVDFSQFEPRGHYDLSPELERYFRAMMWLGRVDLRPLETQADHTQLFHRQQLLSAFALRALMDEEAMARWHRIDDAITAFSGAHDSMTPPQLEDFLRSLGVSSSRDLAGFSDEALAAALIAGDFGVQRVASHVMVNGLAQAAMPLSRSFALFGQRYTVDSHVFSNVVHDRVVRADHDPRMLPSPLDAAYASLGNDDAAPLLESELRRYGYAPALESMRLLVDRHGDEYWSQDLYTSWLGALRALSTRAGAEDAGLPALARTEPWSRRVLSTQLASWTELRHDTLLYTKQSYTGGGLCEFPDAYVEPYPAFFDAVASFGLRGEQAVATIEGMGATHARRWFADVQDIATRLAQMARHQRSGIPFTPEQMEFINDAVRAESICGPEFATGWYGRLSYSSEMALYLDPVVADVHTQPFDAAGAPVGRVLHVGTGMPRAAVMTFETCAGPRAYVGLVSSYFEQVTDGFERLTDDEWAATLARDGHPADPAFLGDLVMR